MHGLETISIRKELTRSYVGLSVSVALGWGKQGSSWSVNEGESEKKCKNQLLQLIKMDLPT